MNRSERNTFASLEIKPELLDLLKQQGIIKPTPIQLETIPLIRAGRDVIAQAQTGTGKTLAFVLPLLQQVNPQTSRVQVLIITPTRELALQITSEVRKLAGALQIRVLASYGGQDVEGQIRKLQTVPQIVVATPGRLLDHLRRGTINIGKLDTLVLDEADQMLEMGFLPEVEQIIAQAPSRRQTLLFSATISSAVRRLANSFTESAVSVKVEGNQITLEAIKQYAVETTDRTRQPLLIQMIEQYRPFMAVIFCRTKIRAKKLTEVLASHRMNVAELHGDLSQSKREQVMKQFREAKLQLLVATDVAARGLDVEGVTHVFNYDMPHDAEAYIHRIGRTGRAGQSGYAYTFVSPRDRQKLQMIEKAINMPLIRMEVRAELDETAAPSKSGNAKKSKQQRSSSDQGRSRNKQKPGRNNQGRSSSKQQRSRSDQGRSGSNQQPGRSDQGRSGSNQQAGRKERRSRSNQQPGRSDQGRSSSKQQGSRSNQRRSHK